MFISVFVYVGMMNYLCRQDETAGCKHSHGAFINLNQTNLIRNAAS
jgi:hypothetical protein